MLKKKLIAVTMLGCMAGTAQATSIILEGDYVKTAVSDDGTLGYGSGISPGILYDKTGTGTFTIDDYLTPGEPYESFSVRVGSAGSDLYSNGNSHGDDITKTAMADTSAGTDNSISWSGEVASLFTIDHEYFFGDTGENIEITTTITALTALDDVSFVRVLDPDQDVRTAGTHRTINGLGRDANADGDFDDVGDTAISDWSRSEGATTGLTIGLFSDSSYDHAAGIDSSWSRDPSTYLTLQDDGDGDYAIAMAFWFGALAAGDVVSFDYSYVMGETLATVTPPGTGEVPVPAALFMFAPALLGFFGLRRKVNKVA
jgi:hypothetical protein